MNKSVTGAEPASFLDRYPDYETTRQLDGLRAAEYGYLDERHQTYLDYTGSGLAAASQHQAHHARLATSCFGNPHSVSPSSRLSTELVELTRRAILGYFNASADDYAVIFTANATGACRLVGEAYPFGRWTRGDRAPRAVPDRLVARPAGRADARQRDAHGPDLRPPGHDTPGWHRRFQPARPHRRGRR